MDTQPDINRIAPRDLKAKMDRGESCLLIDTLTNDHFSKVHIPGAKNACVFGVDFLEIVEEIASGKQETIIVYGSSDKSMDALTAGEKLVRAGYHNVKALEGGLASWKANGYPLDGTHIESATLPEDLFRIENGLYRANTEESVLEWTGRNPNKKHFGTLPLVKGEMTVGSINTTGRFEFDMSRMKNTDLSGDESQPVLLAHLMSDDFFFIQMFPKTIFTVTSMIPRDASSLSSPNFDVTGDLELRGNTNKMNFPATISPDNSGGFIVEAHFDIDRTRWRVLYGSARFFERLGMHLVFDLISIQLRFVLVKETS